MRTEPMHAAALATIAVLSTAVGRAEVHTLKPVAESNQSRSRGVLEPVRIGLLVGTGLPDLFNLALLLKVTPYLGAGLNLGIIPRLRISYYGEATLAYQEYDAFLRVHPFGGGLFVGTGLGYATIRGSLVGTIAPAAYVGQLAATIRLPEQVYYESRGYVRTMVLTPRIGYLYVTGIGFSFGIDLGVQVPIAPSTIGFESQLDLPPDTPEPIDTAVRTQLLDPNDQKVRESLETVGRTPLPTFHLRLGWMI